MARPQPERVWLVSDLHRSQTLPNIFHHCPHHRPSPDFHPPPISNHQAPYFNSRHQHHRSIRLLYSPVIFASPVTSSRPPTTAALALSDLVALPPPTRSLAHLLSSRAGTSTSSPGVTRYRHIPFFHLARSWRWSRNRPAFASASRFTNSGIMTGLIGERGFAPASSWK